MKLVQFIHGPDGPPGVRLGLVDNDRVLDLTALPSAENICVMLPFSSYL